jgi:histidine kinase/DNA gyrase B/HSP90-like ATPase
VDNTYLVADTPQTRVVNDVEYGVTQVNVLGVWSSELRSALARQLRACVAEKPQAVIVNLTRLSDPTGASASTWRTAQQFVAAEGSGIELILVATPVPLLEHLRNNVGGSGIVTVATMSTAYALARRPQWPRRRLVLPAADTSPARARALAGDACLAWDLPRRLYPAMLIVSELTDNAIVHAGTDLTITMSLRRHTLHLAVQDHHRGLPQIIEARPYRAGQLIEQRGAGLRLVRDAATAWGAIPCRVGKVVWATLAADSDRSGR